MLQEEYLVFAFLFVIIITGNARACKHFSNTFFINLKHFRRKSLRFPEIVVRRRLSPHERARGMKGARVNLNTNGWESMRAMQSRRAKIRAPPDSFCQLSSVGIRSFVWTSRTDAPDDRRGREQTAWHARCQRTDRVCCVPRGRIAESVLSVEVHAFSAVYLLRHLPALKAVHS